MANTPHPTHAAQPPKPSTPPAPPPRPTPPTTPPRPPNQPPSHDPQEAKLEAHAAPPRWDEPKEAKPAPAFTPKPALDPREEKPPEGAYPDGMGIAQEQRLRSAWIEQHGMKEYHEATDQRPPEERTNRQVPGVTPPTKRE